jgi:intracellular septation protein
MQYLFDFFPIILFFTTFKVTQSIILATSIAIPATFVQLIWHRWKNGKYNKTHIVSFFSILILGGATIFLKNELFIKWKPTVVYWLLAIIVWASQLFGKKPIIRRLIENNVELPNKIWQTLNLSCGLFFTLMGVANVYIMYNYDTDTWVNFKLFGTLGLTLCFILIQGVIMAKHVKIDP